MNLGALVRLRRDRDGAVHQADALFHADQPDAVSLHRETRMKAHATVANMQVHCSLPTLETHLAAARATMFDGVTQRFLQDPKQAQRGVPRDVFMEIVGVTR